MYEFKGCRPAGLFPPGMVAVNVQYCGMLGYEMSNEDGLIDCCQR